MQRGCWTKKRCVQAGRQAALLTKADIGFGPSAAGLHPALCGGGGTPLLSQWRMHCMTTRRCRRQRQDFHLADAQPQIQKHCLNLSHRRCELSPSLRMRMQTECIMFVSAGQQVLRS